MDATDPTKIIERLNELENRVDTLERENDRLEHENERLTDAVAATEQKNQQLQSTVDTLEDELNDLEQKNQLLRSRIDGLCDSIDTVEDNLSTTRRTSEEKTADLAHRVSTLEDTLDLDVFDIESRGLDPTASTLEQVAALPEDVKEEKMANNKSLVRASVAFEKFDQWSEYTPQGRVINSSNLRTVLSEALDTNLEWSQVYRVMEAFDEATQPEYEYLDHNRHGKILIRHNDATQARADAATNAVVSDD